MEICEQNHSQPDQFPSIDHLRTFCINRSRLSLVISAVHAAIDKGQNVLAVANLAYRQDRLPDGSELLASTQSSVATRDLDLQTTARSILFQYFSPTEGIEDYRHQPPELTVTQLNLAIGRQDIPQIEGLAVQLLLFLSTPSSRVKCELVGSLGGCEIVHNALRVCNEHQARLAVLLLLQCIRGLCSCGDSFETCVVMNVDEFRTAQLEALIAMVLRTSEDAEILAAACGVVPYLTRVSEKQLHADSAEMCETLVSVLQQQMTVVSVVKTACRAITSLVANTNDARTYLAVADACEALVHVLDVHRPAVDVVEEACCAISVLVRCDGNDIRLGEVGACEALVQVLEQHMSVISVVEKVCSTIRNLAWVDDNQGRLASAGACEIVVRALQQHMSVVSVVEEACCAIRNLAWLDGNKSRLASAGACTAVVRALKHHMAVGSSVVEACCAIRNLAAKNHDNQVQLVRLGACDAIIRGLELHMFSDDVARVACGAIANLSTQIDSPGELGRTLQLLVRCYTFYQLPGIINTISILSMQEATCNLILKA